jgi:hypothetical protein
LHIFIYIYIYTHPPTHTHIYNINTHTQQAHTCIFLCKSLLFDPFDPPCHQIAARNRAPPTIGTWGKHLRDDGYGCGCGGVNGGGDVDGGDDGTSITAAAVTEEMKDGWTEGRKDTHGCT